jgi:hypothetical protein
MDTFTTQTLDHQHTPQMGAADLFEPSLDLISGGMDTLGSSIQDSDLEQSLTAALETGSELEFEPSLLDSPSVSENSLDLISPDVEEGAIADSSPTDPNLTDSISTDAISTDLISTDSDSTDPAVSELSTLGFEEDAIALTPNSESSASDSSLTETTTDSPETGTPGTDSSETTIADLGSSETGSSETDTPGSEIPETILGDTASLDTETSEIGTSDTATPDPVTTDAATSDTGTSDAGTPDAGTPDAATSDAATSDAATSDAATSDAATSDTAISDTGTPDTGTPDVGTPDTETPDAGTPETGAPEIGTPDTGTPETVISETTLGDTGTPDLGTSETETPEIGSPQTETPETGTPETGTVDSTPAVNPTSESSQAEAPLTGPLEPAVSQAQEVQQLNQEEAPSEAPAPEVSVLVGDTIAQPANEAAVANSLQQVVAEPLIESLADVVPGIDPTTVEAPPADPAVQGFKVDESAQAPANANDHDHGNPGSAPELHVDLDSVASVRQLDGAGIRQVRNLAFRMSFRGDFLDPGAGNNTVIGARGNDVIMANGGGLNTLTTGTGLDTIVLGKETTNRIFDFNPERDRFALPEDLDISDIVIAQGKNPGKGGLNQPLDSVNNALVIDKSNGHVLAALTFVSSETLSERNFVKVNSASIDAARNSRFSNTQEGSGQLNGSLGRDKLVGQAGDDFLAPGDDSFRFRTAISGEEFPFKTDSPGVTRLRLDLKGGVLRVDGRYRNYDGAPLFSQGETTIDPSAIILNGAGADALVKGFLSVPKDVEGNSISGTHLHFSPSGDERGNFADATVARYFENTPTSAKAGRIKGEFELTPQEQAALLGGNFYVNVHTNVDLDKDGKGGFPTGENRINLNKNVVRFV